MFSEAIRLGDKLNLKCANVGDNKEYWSKLVAMNEDGTMSVTMPEEDGGTVVLKLNSKYHVTFYTSKGPFVCPVVVKKCYQKRGSYVAVIKTLDIPRRMQRRQYFRIACMTALKIYTIPEVVIESVLSELRTSNTTYGYSELQLRIRALNYLIENDKREGTRFVEMTKAIITDISGGGLRFKTKKELTNESALFLVFAIHDGKYMVRAFGEIIESRLMIDHGEIYDNRLHFTEISSIDREEIVRYVLDEERILRQKEKGNKYYEKNTDNR